MTHTALGSPARARATSPSLWYRFKGWEASGILIALGIFAIVLSIAAPNFLSAYNLTVVARAAAFVGLVALGQTLVLLLGASIYRWARPPAFRPSSARSSSPRPASIPGW